MNNKLETIAVCVDGSEPSWQALEYVKDLCETFSPKRVLVIHVIPSLSSMTAPHIAEGSDVVQANLIQFLEDQAEQLEEDIREELSELEAEVQMCFPSGNPGVRILEITENEDADLILMGNRGLSGLASILLGSVSERVARNAPCSVLIVRPKKGEAE